MINFALGLAVLMLAADPAPWPTYGEGVAVSVPGDEELLPEISGMIVSRHNDDLVWVHNDSGAEAQLYALRLSTGKLVGTATLPKVTAVDWEDIAVGPGKDKRFDYLYIADFGNNQFNRKTMVIYRIPEPSVPEVGSFQSLVWTSKHMEHMVLEYPDDVYDAETLLVDPLTGGLVIVTKDHGRDLGTSHIFKTPAQMNPNAINTLERVGSISFPTGGRDRVTGGDISPDRRWVILRTYVEARLYRRATGQSVAEALLGEHLSIPLNSEPQGEAIAFGASTPEGPTFYTVSELGPKRRNPDKTMKPIFRYQAR